jgi:hypothetical protein
MCARRKRTMNLKVLLVLEWVCRSKQACSPNSPDRRQFRPRLLLREALKESGDDINEQMSVHSIRYASERKQNLRRNCPAYLTLPSRLLLLNIHFPIGSSLARPTRLGFAVAQEKIASSTPPSGQRLVLSGLMQKPTWVTRTDLTT